MNNQDIPDSIKKKIRELKDKFNKGSRRPFLYFGTTAVVLFFLICCLVPPSGEAISPAFINYQEIEEPFFAANTNFRESPDLIFIQKNSLAAASPPVTVTPQVLGALAGDTEYEALRKEIIEYVVGEGDTLSGIAERFGISENTIRWANDIQGTTVQSGQRLAILPVSGALHLVREYDTLSEIAGWYKADTEDIVIFNNLSSAEKIFAGDLLIIPDGTKPSSLPAGRLTLVAGSYFICPIPAPCRITQGLHHYNAIDFSNGRCGEPVYAAAGGTIQRTGYDRIGGNYVRILHANGVVTYYGHLSGIIVSSGQRVLQGQIIGYTGHTGYTIPAGPAGCHLHFEVRGAANPFAR